MENIILLVLAGLIILLLLLWIMQANSKRRRRTPKPAPPPTTFSTPSTAQSTRGQTLLVLVFLGGVGGGVLGLSLNIPFAQIGFLVAIIAFVILLISSIVQQGRTRAAENSEKVSPWWLVPIIGLPLIAVTIAYHLHEQEQTGIRTTLETFIQACQSEDFERAWLLYQPKVRAKFSLERFERGVRSTRFSQLQRTELTELNPPYKSNYGEYNMILHDSEGQWHHFSIVFGGEYNNKPPLLDNRYFIRRFSYNNPRFRKAIELFLQSLRERDFETAGKMAYIHVRDAEGNLRYTMNGPQLRANADKLGLLQDGKRRYHTPAISPNGDVEQIVSIGRGDNSQQIRFRLGINQLRPGPGRGIRIYAIEAYQSSWWQGLRQ